MKRKISITVSEELLDEIGRIGGEEPRSATVERALAEYVRTRRRAAIDARDAELLDRHADLFHEVALDVLEHQAAWDPDDV